MNKTLLLVNRELLRKVTCYAPLASKITKCPPACDDALPPEAIGSEKLLLYTDWVQHMLRNLAGSSCRCCAIKTLITIQANYKGISERQGRFCYAPGQKITIESTSRLFWCRIVRRSSLNHSYHYEPTSCFFFPLL